MKSIVAWFAGNHVAANLLMFFILVAGVLTAVGIKLEIFPDSAMDKIQVSVSYPGASPSEVEDGVIRQIEENIAGLEGIRRIDSVAREGIALITVELITGGDIKKLLEDIKSEVDRITTLPEQAEAPVIREMTQRIQVISLAVYGNAPETTLKHLAQTIKDELTAINGITQAELAAARPNEIHVEISEQTLRKHQLTLGMVADAISRSSLDLPAGSVKAKEGEVLIRAVGRRYNANEYLDIPVITRADGTRITLEQIADIREGFAEIDLSARFQKQPAILINVFRVADQSALDVAGKVKDYAAQISAHLPEGVHVGHYQDMSLILKSRIDLLLKNMLLGLMLVSLLLTLFLNARLAFWVTLGIPLSFAFGLIFLPGYDVSINMVSLFAFIMVLGIVVDDAIIVGENVFRKHEENLDPLPASIEGTYEVGRPVIFSVLTTMVAFWPILVVGGVMGNIMRHVPVVIIAVLLGSLIESLLILPAHLQRSKVRQKGRPLRPKKMTRALEWFIDKPYDRFLKTCLRWRYVTVAVGVSILVLTLGIWKADIIKFTFFPKVEGDIMQCTLTMPSGTPEHRILEVVRQIEASAEAMLLEQDRLRPADAAPLMEHSISILGAHINPRGGGEVGGHLAHVFIQLLEGEKRDMSSQLLIGKWRREVGVIPDAESLMFTSEIHSVGKPVEVHLSMDDQSLLLTATERLKQELDGFTGVFDIADSYLPGKMEMQLSLKPDAAGLGLKLSDLALQVRHGFYGAEALRFQRDKNEVKVLIRYPENERLSLGNVESMRIRTSSGSEVPFAEVAEVEMKQGYASIERARRMQVIKVTADVDESVTNANEVRRFLTTQFLPELAIAYPDLKYAIEGEGQEQAEVFSGLKRNFIIALFGIYVLLAVPFRSFSQPLIVMAAIPFGIVGAVFGHLLMGYNLSIMSLFGIVGLSGVVVNASLVLIDRINRIRNSTGISPLEAVIDGGKMRFRAIILTSLTTFGGLIPIMLERSLQARFLIPMAISLAFGVLFATLITLLLIPAGYLILDDIHNGIERLKARFAKRLVSG
jgi:multidrug efflux pump subunit AcrB